MTTGFTLPELVVGIGVGGLLAVLALGRTSDQWARLQVETAARRLVVGIERGRDAAERAGAGCALALSADGWRGSASIGAVACGGADTELAEGLVPADVQIGSTFASGLRFTANGLAIDGGTVVVGHPGTALVRCVVVSPPLGVMRMGRYSAAVSALPLASRCLPDPTL